jgi:hypothetical protein
MRVEKDEKKLWGRVNKAGEGLEARGNGKGQRA